MKGIIFILMVLVGFLLITGCEEGATIKIYNQTSHNLYAEIDFEEYLIEGNENKNIDVDTEEKVFLFDDGKTVKTIKLDGETYQLWDEYNEYLPGETSITVTPGKTYKIYCNPTSASVKLVNNSDYPINALRYRKNKEISPSEWFTITYDPPLENGDSAYYHLTPQTEQNRIFYNFSVESEGQVIYSIGDEFQGVELQLDQQHLIEINPDTANNF